MSKPTIMTRARDIYQTEGLAKLLTRTLRFLRYSLFLYRIYYLFEFPIANIDKIAESDFKPKISDFSLHIVHSNKEADILEADGFKFRSHVAGARERLDKEAIAFCVFVGKEFACSIWIALTDDARKSLQLPPRKVNFPNREAVIGTLGTAPKYRGIGFATYCVFKELQWLSKNGWALARATVRQDNLAVHRLATKLGFKLYGKGIYIKILRWKFWKEKRQPVETFRPVN